MKKANEVINFDNISDDDIARWNREILEYNRSYDSNNAFKNISPDLNYKIEEVSSYLMSSAIDMERNVTNDLYDLLGEDGYFVGLENRFKNKERLKEKIYNRVIGKQDDPISVGNSICDSLRYTIIFDYDTYIEQIDAFLNDLEEMDYKIIKFKNRWDEVYYKGISVHLEDTQKRKFEIQFHTKENYDIKEVFSREPYNLIRSNNAPLDLLVKAYLLRRIYQRKVHIPPQALNYQYVSKLQKHVK